MRGGGGLFDLPCLFSQSAVARAGTLELGSLQWTCGRQGEDRGSGDMETIIEAECTVGTVDIVTGE